MELVYEVKWKSDDVGIRRSSQLRSVAFYFSPVPMPALEAMLAGFESG